MIYNKPLHVLPREKTEKAKINQEENGKKPLATQEVSRQSFLECHRGITREAACEGRLQHWPQTLLLALEKEG